MEIRKIINFCKLEGENNRSYEMVGENDLEGDWGKIVDVQRGNYRVNGLLIIMKRADNRKTGERDQKKIYLKRISKHIFNLTRPIMPIGVLHKERSLTISTSSRGYKSRRRL